MQYIAIHRCYDENKSPLELHSTELCTALIQLWLWKSKVPLYQDLHYEMLPPPHPQSLPYEGVKMQGNNEK